MSGRIRDLEHALRLVGQARRDGVFSDSARRPTWSGPRALPMSTVRDALIRRAWLRVGLPLAAAASVAVLFVGPVFWNQPVAQKVAEMSSAVPTDLSPTVAPLALANTTSPSRADCDYNGDGRIDGRDIQAFVSRLEQLGDVRLEADQLQQCLLGT